MFTGIVEDRRPVARARFEGGSLWLEIDLGDLAAGVAVGDSIAMAGCCLTVSRLEGTVAGFHLMGETLRLTTFKDLSEGDLVNVERSLRLDDRLGGHLVSGHVDGLAEVVSVSEKEGQTDLKVRLPDHLKELVVPKGSISIDGVSLTIAAIEGSEVTVCLIPHTLQATTLGLLRPGDRVHLEMDMIGKWVRRLLEPHLP